MADATSWEQDLDAVLNDSTDTEEAEPTEDTASLETDSSPLETDQGTAEETSPDEQNARPDEAEQSAETEVQVAESVTETVKTNWDSEENPHYAKARELEHVRNQAKLLVEQAARTRAQELQTQRIKALSDDDPQRVSEIQQLVTDAQKPVLEQAQRLEGEAEWSAKLATVVEAAAQHVLSSEDHQKVMTEVERMMALPGGPEYLQHDLATRKAERAQYETKLTATEQKVKELERRLAAQSVLKERADNGADLVDSNNGLGRSFQARYDAASGEEALDVILEDLIAR